MEQPMKNNGLLLAMMALDRTISFDGKMPPIVVHPPISDLHPPTIPKSLPPSIAHPSKGSIGEFVVSLLSAIFNERK